MKNRISAVKIPRTQIVVTIGLLASGVAISTAAQAQIPITGGRMTGDAAFFSPLTSPTSPGTTSTPSGTPVLFDVGIRTLRIETPNGTTTTSRFLPSAADFTDTNGNSRPDAGDTGSLQGSLSGVAFSRQGSPVFFQGVPTTLDFTLNSFNASVIQGGTLISPIQAGAAPLIFLPVFPVTLSPQSSTNFEAETGRLDIGPFAATLNGDSIFLPSTLQFRSSGDVPFPIVELGRQVKFDFEGRDVQAEDFDQTGDTLTYSGPTTKFQVQSVGTPGQREFKIDGTVANLDLELSGGTLELRRTGTIDPNQPLSYEVKGDGPGYVAFSGKSSVAFTGSARRDTRFRFEQGSTKLEGKSSGDIRFTLSPTADDIDFDNFTPSPDRTTNVDNTTSGTSKTSGISDDSTPTESNIGTIQINTITSNPTVTFISLFDPAQFENLQGDDDDDENEQYGSNVTYRIYRATPLEVVFERQGDLILIVEREPVLGRRIKKRGRVISAYQQIGLPSRVFPGMQGLRQIPVEQVETATPTDTTTPGTTTP
jgi:hypothetical protein